MLICLLVSFGPLAGAAERLFPVQGVKLWLGTIPGMYNEYTGEPLVTRNFVRLSDVLDRIRADGANHVILQLSAGAMQFPTDNSFLPGTNSPPQPVLRLLARDIKARGLTFAVSLFSNVQNIITGSGGAGTLDRPTPANPAVWFADYRARVLDWAKFSQEIGATEFIFLQDELQPLAANPDLEASWVDLIRTVRGSFSGKIVSALWTPGNGNSITRLPTAIINELDYLGVGFVPNLVFGDNPSVDALVAAYSKDAAGFDPVGFLRDLSVRYGKKIWITDKAFHSFLDAGADEARVFNAAIPLTPSEEVQARLYESFFRVMASQSADWFHGVSFQNFSNIVPNAFPIARFVSGPYSESPQYKQAETVLSDWFNGRRSAALPSTLSNLSVRATMSQGQTLIVGFSVVHGAKPVLVRASGPALSVFNLPGVADPRLTVFDAASAQVMTNDNWSPTLSAFFSPVGAFAWPTGSRDAAVLPTLAGSYSAHASAAGSGSVLVEAYDAGRNIGSEFSNLSARYRVGTGGDVLIAGFVLTGTGQRKLLVRAIGPQLGDFGVTGFLPRPQLAVFDGAREIASATSWAPALAPTFTEVGAFALAPGSADAAMVLTLEAGRGYTAQVSGVGGATGEALIEVYTLP